MTEIEEKLRYSFKDKKLLREALTHSSYNKKHCNERLEFLGDSVLSAVVARHLFVTLPNLSEGSLTKLKAGLVCEASLYSFAVGISLGRFIIMSRGEEMSGGRERKSILADAFEAVIAAIFLDSGYEAAENYILRFLPDVTTVSSRHMQGDFKTELQEVTQSRHLGKPSYETGGIADDMMFTSSVFIDGKNLGTGRGASKKEAEQSAAKFALTALENI